MNNIMNANDLEIIVDIYNSTTDPDRKIQLGGFIVKYISNHDMVLRPDLQAKFLGVEYKENEMLVDLFKEINHIKCNDNIYGFREYSCDDMAYAILCSSKIIYDLMIWSRFGYIDTFDIDAFNALSMIELYTEHDESYFYTEDIKVILNYIRYHMWKTLSDDFLTFGELMKYRKNKGSWQKRLWDNLEYIGVINKDDHTLIEQKEVSDEDLIKAINSKLKELKDELEFADDINMSLVNAKERLDRNIYDTALDLIDDEDMILELDDITNILVNIVDKIKKYRGMN